MLLRPPILSAYEPEDRDEGSIDLLSLARTYERPADRIYPSITARMSRIRFLTAVAVGAHDPLGIEALGAGV